MALKLAPSSALSQPAVLAAGFVVLVMISGTSLWLVAQTRADSQHVVRTLDVKEKLSDLQGLIWQAESDQRGFLLTGDARYRDAFGTDVEAARAALSEAKAALADTLPQSHQAQFLTDLDRAVAAELVQLESTAARREHSGLGALSSAPSDGVEQALISSVARDLAHAITAEEQPWTDHIRRIIDQLRQQARRQLAAQLDATQMLGNLLLLANFGGTALIIALAAVSVAMVRRSAEGLKAAHKALADTNASLEATVARRTAELRQANEEIQHFAHIVSHDLRSPLVNIMGFTSELEAVRKDVFDRLAGLRARFPDDAGSDRELGQDFEEALGFIKSSIARMDGLIKAILKLTREGRRELRLEPLDMTDLVRTAAAGFSYQAQKANASITIDPLPPCVGDRLAVEQIFANLLENALKYLRDDTPGLIRVTGRGTAAEVTYQVEDNGRGIDPKDHERIFEIFRRSGAHDRTGEGVGLTYVRTLVSRLGGTITVRSALGQGSTFTVTLPRRPAAPSPGSMP